jgi:hypothetical protein
MHELKVLALDVTEFSQSAAQPVERRPFFIGENADTENSGIALRLRRKRPNHSRGAEHGEELAPLHGSFARTLSCHAGS